MNREFVDAYLNQVQQNKNDDHDNHTHDPMDDLILGSLKPYQLKNIHEMKAEMKEKERKQRREERASKPAASPRPPPADRATIKKK